MCIFVRSELIENSNDSLHNKGIIGNKLKDILPTKESKHSNLLDLNSNESKNSVFIFENPHDERLHHRVNYGKPLAYGVIEYAPNSIPKKTRRNAMFVLTAYNTLRHNHYYLHPASYLPYSEYSGKYKVAIHLPDELTHTLPIFYAIENIVEAFKVGKDRSILIGRQEYSKIIKDDYNFLPETNSLNIVAEYNLLLNTNNISSNIQKALCDNPTMNWTSISPVKGARSMPEIHDICLSSKHSGGDANSFFKWLLDKVYSPMEMRKKSMPEYSREGIGILDIDYILNQAILTSRPNVADW